MSGRDLNKLRGSVHSAGVEALAAQKKLADARRKLSQLQATGTDKLATARAAVKKAEKAVADSQKKVTKSRDSLSAALESVIGRQRAGLIAPADVPVALLPVGLETRFNGDTLLVRVIPDQIHAEDHEHALTDAEVDAGRNFWREVWRAGTAEPAATEAERTAWARVVRTIGKSRRAAWVVDQTAPNIAERPARATAEGSTLEEPDFPEPRRRPSSWSQAAVARTLPDKFIAIAYRRAGSGGTATWIEIGRAQGRPIADGLQLGPDPNDPIPTVDENGPTLPEGMRWITDTTAAEEAGLLLRVPLPAGTNSIDRLVVFGVLGSLDSAASAERLRDLLVGHHYSSGLEVLPVGTPTNNTAADTSGFSGRDDDSVTFDIERRTPVPPEQSDGDILASALGIPEDTLRGVAHSNDTEQAAAGQMNALVWPAAMGYWLDSLVQPGPTDAIIADIRRHALQMLRGRGPLPPIRVGKQPYGILPVTSLARWLASNEPPGVQQIVRFLRAAMPWWKDGIAHAPVVRANANPDQGVLDALSQLPVSKSVGVRSMVGANASFIPTPYAAAGGTAAQSAAAEGNRQRSMALTAFKALGVEGFPYLGQLVARQNPIPTLHLPYTVDASLPPDQRSAAWQGQVDYLNALPTRTTADFAAENPRTLKSVLALIARRSIMLERVRVGVKQTHPAIAGTLVEAHVRMDSAAVVNAQLISTTATMRIGQTLSAASAVLAGNVTQADGSALAMRAHLDRELVHTPIVAAKHPDYYETVSAIRAMTALPPARVELLLGEALDAMSHRFDAWVTSLATRRLADLRAARPTGITLGAYGMVEDLVRRPAREPVQSPPTGAPTQLSTDSSAGGYIHAPSLAQAATAAVLRAGHLSHADRDPASAALAIDLSSARVRAALGLLDGVRQGQSLGALLGYRAERQLHELGAHVAVEVVRRLAPPPVVTAAGTPEGIPPRAVCDGLALSRLNRQTVLAETTAAGSNATAVTTVLDELIEAVDAVADLLLAEGVHQIVRGNPDRAAAALDALNRGEGITVDPEVVRTPRSGTSLTQRVVIAIGAKPTAPAGWPKDGVRAKAEPRVAAWAGTMLGNPSAVKFKVTTPGVAGALTFTLKDLGIGALDVVFEPLLPRVLRHARSKGAGEGAQLDTSAPEVAALLAMAEMLHRLLTRSREGTGLDLMRPQDRGSVVNGPQPVDDSNLFTTPVKDVDKGNRRARLDAARATLKAARDALPELAQTDAAPAEGSLKATLDRLASFGLAPGGDPARPPDTLALIALRNAASAQLKRSEDAPDDASALFGEGFPVLALAAPPFPEVVAKALAKDPVAAAPADVVAAYGGHDEALTSWLEQTGRVRPSVGRLADVLLAARLRSGAENRLRAMQLPAEPFPDAPAAQRRQWVGFQFPAALTEEPVTSIVMHAPFTLNPAAGVALLVVDDYTEVVPFPVTTTGVSFGFDAPGARPPQSILLCVPPVMGAPWSIDTLAGVLGEALDLAKIRMVDLSTVAWAGRFVPTIYLTDSDVASGLDLPMKDIVKHAFTELMSRQP